jgi:predicted RNase H-like nuclease (RuvC/YqgF family)
MLVLRYKQLEAKLGESERNNALLIKKIEELNNLINEEGIKRSKHLNDLDASGRERQALEEKLVHFTQQIEFMSRKITAYEQEIASLKQKVSDLEAQVRTIPGLESKIQFLTSQIERLQLVIQEKDATILKLQTDFANSSKIAA